MSFFVSAVRRPRTPQPSSLTPRQVARAYNFPLDTATGKGCTIGLIELGGGYVTTKVDQYFLDNHLTIPNYTAVNVSSGKNAPDGPNGADGEVQLDMIVPGAIAPDAKYRVYFAGNVTADFLAAIKRAATECNVISISWGGSENSWSATDMKAFEAAFAAARALGVAVLVAAGDTGSGDSSGDGAQVDFPASSPSVISCGGTRLRIDPTGARSLEVTWNDSPTSSATGGGVSKQFPGRQVPDIAGNADPDTGYAIYIDGDPYVIGGTSAVAPLMAGLYALLFELNITNNGKAFDFGNLLLTNPQAFYDVTSGNNGVFRAGPGRDDVTGLGVPDGMKLALALTGGIPAPVPPTVPPPATDPIAAFPKASFAAIETWVTANDL